jgi:hypothetical protein
MQEQRETLRDLRYAKAQAASTSFLSSSTQELKDALEPLRNAISNITNYSVGAVAKTAGAIIDIQTRGLARWAADEAMRQMKEAHPEMFQTTLRTVFGELERAGTTPASNRAPRR